MAVVLTDIHFECATCGQKLVVEAHAAGEHVDCPQCRENLTIPRHTSPERLRRELDSAHVELKALRQERDRSAAAFAQVSADLKEERAALQDAMTYGEDLATKLEKLAGEKHATEENLSLSRRRAEALQVQLTAHERDLAERSAALESTRAALSATDDTLALTRAELAAAAVVAEQKAALESVLQELQRDLASAERSAEEAARTAQRWEGEAAALRAGLSESQSGRELVALRDRLQAMEDERDAALRRQHEAEVSAHKARSQRERLRTEGEALRKRFRDFERRTEAQAPSTIEDDRAVLRGIIDRQSAEMVERIRELTSLRRKQLSLRLAYALVSLVGLSLAGVVAFLVHQSGWLREIGF